MIKKSITFALVAVMVLAIGSQAEGLKGTMQAGGFLGWAFGLGDPFGTTKFTGGEVNNKGGIGFGGTFHYGITPKMMAGGEIGFQSYKFETKINSSVPLIGNIDGSVSETEVNILANFLYALSSDFYKKAIYLTFGGGMYGYGTTEFGVFAGVLYYIAATKAMNLYVQLRMHLVMADTTLKILQVAVGANFPIGAK